ncbi:unnamed protein product [Protopolystoma xenopodis]|uniref:Uncharacterized protein n=1 Tax=Protopolystoma xenopodis TaxID=117903 RepID=A0A3S5B005_9PLAT|nr:unnamed protein product [Protopolystoma xenopodis]
MHRLRETCLLDAYARCPNRVRGSTEEIIMAGCTESNDYSRSPRDSASLHLFWTVVRAGATGIGGVPAAVIGTGNMRQDEMKKLFCTTTRATGTDAGWTKQEGGSISLSLSLCQSLSPYKSVSVLIMWPNGSANGQLHDWVALPMTSNWLRGVFSHMTGLVITLTDTLTVGQRCTKPDPDDPDDPAPFASAGLTHPSKRDAHCDSVRSGLVTESAFIGYASATIVFPSHRLSLTCQQVLPPAGVGL